MYRATELLYDSQNKQDRIKEFRHILSAELLGNIAYLEPDLNFEMYVSGFDYRTLKWAAKITWYKISSNFGVGRRYSMRKPLAKMYQWRDMFIKECWIHSRHNKLPYKREFVELLKNKYHIHDDEIMCDYGY